MQDLQLTFGPYGYLSQCPQVDSQCPTCSEYTALKLSFASLQSQIQMLTDRVRHLCFNENAKEIPSNCDFHIRSSTCS